MKSRNEIGKNIFDLEEEAVEAVDDGWNHQTLTALGPMLYNVFAKLNDGAYSQCGRIGQFLKVLGDKFSYKSSPNI